MPRKLIAFHDEDRRALEDMAEDRSTTFQELMDEAVRDLLKKYGRHTDLKSAFRRLRPPTWAASFFISYIADRGDRRSWYFLGRDRCIAGCLGSDWLLSPRKVTNIGFSSRSISAPPAFAASRNSPEGRRPWPNRKLKRIVLPQTQPFSCSPRGFGKQTSHLTVETVYDKSENNLYAQNALASRAVSI